MSWLDKIRTDLTITTGDGVEYVPNWMNASKQVEYNMSQFNYPELDGTHADRRRPKGASYNLEVIFQGEEHLDTAEDFEASAANPRAWTITHPFYGAILVQPVSLLFDNSALNVSRITGIVIQTIGPGELRPKVSEPEKVADDKFIADEQLASNFGENLPEKKVSSLQLMQQNVNELYNNISKEISDNTDASEYLNKYNEVNALINSTVYNAGALISQVQALISMPAQFAQTVANRLAMFQTQVSVLTAGVANLTGRDEKVIFETMAGTAVTGLIVSAFTNIGTTYINRVDVLAVIDTLYSVYTTYTASLDGLQTDNNGSPDSYIPDVGGLLAVQQLVGYALGSLSTFASNGRQERVTYAEEDTNVWLIAHKFYGIKEDDSTLDAVIAENKITIKELLEVPKGRRLVYYI